MHADQMPLQVGLEVSRVDGRRDQYIAVPTSELVREENVALKRGLVTVLVTSVPVTYKFAIVIDVE